MIALSNFLIPGSRRTLGKCKRKPCHSKKANYSQFSYHNRPVTIVIVALVECRDYVEEHKYCTVTFQWMHFHLTCRFFKGITVKRKSEIYCNKRLVMCCWIQRNLQREQFIRYHVNMIDYVLTIYCIDYCIDYWLCATKMCTKSTIIVFGHHRVIKKWYTLRVEITGILTLCLWIFVFFVWACLKEK